MKKAFITIFTLIIMFAAASYDSYAILPNYNTNISLSTWFIGSTSYDHLIMKRNKFTNGIWNEEIVTYIWLDNTVNSNTINITDEIYYGIRRYVYRLQNMPSKVSTHDVSLVVPRENNTYTLSIPSSTFWTPTDKIIKYETFDATINDIIYSDFEIVSSSVFIYKEGIKIYTPPPSAITNPNEYLVFNSPEQNSKRISKTVPVVFQFKIEGTADDAQSVFDSIELASIDYANLTYKHLSENEDVKDWSVDLINSRYYHDSGTVMGTVRVNITYQDDFVGSDEIQVMITNSRLNKQLINHVNFEIISFVDSNGDGYDDVTGLPHPNIVNPPSGDDISITSAVETLSDAISSIRQMLSVVTTLITVIFSFLPPPVYALIFIILTLIILTTILKVLRG